MALSLFDLAPGKTLLDRFEVCDKKRGGGMGTAIEVRALDGGEQFELQIFPEVLFETPDQAQAFAESMAPWEATSTQVVPALKERTLLDGGTVVLRTAYPIGGSLREWMNENETMTLGPALQWARSVLSGLSEVHSLGLVHGDIKPYSVHVEVRGDKVQTQILDGGVTPGLWSAKGLGDRTALIGTPLYSPVEQFGGDSPDAQSDVYNVAAVLFELIAGSLPWQGSSFLEVFQAKLDRTPPSLAASASMVEVPPSLDAAVARGLAADKRQRFADAAEFLEALSTVEAEL